MLRTNTYDIAKRVGAVAARAPSTRQLAIARTPLILTHSNTYQRTHPTHTREYHHHRIALNNAPTSTASPAEGANPPAAAAASDSTAATVAAAPKVPLSQRIKKWIEKNQLKWINFSIAGGITFGVYSVYSFGFDLIDFYLDTREVDAPYLAFFTGAGASLLSVALYKSTRRFYLIKSGRMYREVLRNVFRNENVRETIGKDVRQRTLQRMQRYGRNHLFQATPATPAAAAAAMAPYVPANFRYVSFLPAKPHYRPDKDGWARYWQPRRLQFMFWIEGSNGGGLVSAEVEQMLRGEYDDINVCVVDLLDKGEQIVVRAQSQPGKRKHDLTSTEEEETGVRREKDLFSTRVRKE